MKRVRVWNKNAQRFITDDIAVRNDGPYILTYDWHHDGGKSWGSPYDEYVIQYYTGLKDKNGKDICDGDIIVNYISYDESLGGQLAQDIGVVRWISMEDKWDYSGWYAHPAELPWGDDNNVEIIGNIFENPELLKN